MLNKKYKSVREMKRTLEERLDNAAFDAQIRLAHWLRTFSTEDFVQDSEGMNSLTPYLEVNLLVELNGLFNTTYKVDITAKDLKILKETKKPLYDPDSL